MDFIRGEHKGMAKIRRYPYRMGISMGFLVTFAMFVFAQYTILYCLFLGVCVGAGTAVALSPGRTPSDPAE